MRVLAIGIEALAAIGKVQLAAWHGHEEGLQRCQHAGLLERVFAARRQGQVDRPSRLRWHDARIGATLEHLHASSATRQQQGEQAASRPRADDGNQAADSSDCASTATSCASVAEGVVQRHRCNAQDVRLAPVDDDAACAERVEQAPSGVAASVRAPTIGSLAARVRAVSGMTSRSPSESMPSSSNPPICPRLGVQRGEPARLEKLQRGQQRCRGEDRRIADLPDRRPLLPARIQVPCGSGWRTRVPTSQQSRAGRRAMPLHARKRRRSRRVRHSDICSCTTRRSPRQRRAAAAAHCRSHGRDRSRSVRRPSARRRDAREVKRLSGEVLHTWPQHAGDFIAAFDAAEFPVLLVDEVRCRAQAPISISASAPRPCSSIWLTTACRSEANAPRSIRMQRRASVRSDRNSPSAGAGSR